ncbi:MULTISPECIES: ABC transporter permease subunit [Bacillus cereus group]|jgi:peptide/nickel transport system permease protein|uniref:Peptide ABC transporter permease n=2 Tax=Bacillus toyonensis TaxID=155322 RepID=A0A1X3MWT0_9BACI|nr:MULTISPECIES: ABC transporter permease subunit [Bacillus cereus group]EEL35957.1 Binding-protein-dependent transport system inner membrane component [Bacillus cereus Rock3-28]OTW79438.1 peptide ABC transporter permease [Bacillus thuringiensis serovar cameroun]MBJ7932158.1 ABC transporter permease subunit [Bacillus cereus group sp. N31]MBJ7948628.1 ABC transporter permease subunit [Bacillus cereus group sp. N24]MED3540519.1 ABC transporter permease subunit [Bacillus toyonensis]
MVKKVFLNGMEMTIQFIISILGIICLGALPKLFYGFELHVSEYIKSLKEVFLNLMDLSNLQYVRDKFLFPQLFVHYKETIVIFLAAFFISLFVAFCIVYMIMSSSPRIQHRIKSFLIFLESIPDILLILVSQILVIWFFKQTGFLPFQIASIGGESIRGLPILCLSIPTTIMFVKMLVLRFENELEKDYVLFAKAKGLNRFHILNRHILRNVLLSTLFFAKTNVFFMLSNLYIIEWIFNTSGIFMFLKSYMGIRVEVFIVSVLLIYIPIFIIFKLFHYLIPAAMKERL